MVLVAEAVEEVLIVLFAFVGHDFEAPGETVAEGVEGDRLLARGGTWPLTELGIGAVGAQLGGGDGSAPYGSRFRMKAGPAVNTLADSISFGEEFGSEFVEKFGIRLGTRHYGRSFTVGVL